MGRAEEVRKTERQQKIKTRDGKHLSRTTNDRDREMEETGVKAINLQTWCLGLNVCAFTCE